MVEHGFWRLAFQASYAALPEFSVWKLVRTSVSWCVHPNFWNPDGGARFTACGEDGTAVVSVPMSRLFLILIR